MAVRYKIEKTEFDALSDEMKKEYKETNGMYLLDVTGVTDHPEVVKLKTAKDGETTRASELTKQITALKAEKKTLEMRLSEAPDDEKITTLREEYEGKIKALETERDEVKTNFDGFKRKTTIGGTAAKLVDDLFEVPDILRDGLIQQIEKRLDVEEKDGSDPIIRVLNSDGTPSAKNIDELRKEYVDNAGYKDILKGSQASGSSETNPSDTPKTPGAKSKKDISEMSDEELSAHMETLEKQD